MNIIQGENRGSSIKKIVQKTSSQSSIPTAYFAEILELSQDRPTNFLQFNVHDAKEKLESMPMIKNALVKKMKPDTIYIEYEMRSIVAILGDYTNTAFDEKGVCFPYSPFYVAKHLSVLFLSKELKLKELLLFQDIVSNFPLGQVVGVDLSKYEDKSGGKREIVVVLDGEIFLRLTPKNYLQEICNYHTFMEKNIVSRSCIIDLRSEGVGLWKEI